MKNKKINNKIYICTSCKKRIIGYYFCPECGQEGTDLTENENNKNYKIAIWIPHSERK